VPMAMFMGPASRPPSNRRITPGDGGTRDE
jgi:hypothetical protein